MDFVVLPKKKLAKSFSVYGATAFLFSLFTKKFQIFAHRILQVCFGFLQALALARDIQFKAERDIVFPKFFYYRREPLSVCHASFLNFPAVDCFMASMFRHLHTDLILQQILSPFLRARRALLIAPLSNFLVVAREQHVGYFHSPVLRRPGVLRGSEQAVLEGVVQR